jgi:hypothetical protein
MGNCCIQCFQSEVNTRSTVAPGNYSLASGKLEDSGKQIFKMLFKLTSIIYFPCADTACHPSRSEESEDSSFIGSSTDPPFVNGSGLDNREAKGIEIRRPFYVLIPPLVGRGSSGSGK